MSAPPGISDFNLSRYRHGIIYFDAQISPCLRSWYGQAKARHAWPKSLCDYKQMSAGGRALNPVAASPKSWVDVF
jgi:hypothetical protein